MEKLSQYLTEHGIRQADFAQEIGTTQATVSRLASNTARRRPSLELAIMIERATGGEVPASSWVDAK